jgi:hypothetical protein
MSAVLTQAANALGAYIFPMFFQSVGNYQRWACACFKWKLGQERRPPESCLIA